MRRICFIIMLFLCFALQGCEKADCQENETVTYVNSSESRESEDTPETKTEDIKETDKMDAYYGCYQITQFYPTIYYRNRKYDVLPEQEADMMLGRIIIMEADLLVTYDSERVLGTKEGRDGFDGNYILKEYTIENPQYMCELMTTEPMDFPGEFREQIGNVITTPQLSPYGPQYYYTISETDQMLLYSTLTGQYFLLERENQNQEELPPKKLSNAQINQLLEELYGTYEITEFLPTKFYPAKDSCGYEILPQEEADMMIGQKIVIREELFCTYDNNRKPNSWIADRLEDGFWIEKVDIENPEYRVERKLRKDIYGLRDDMLPKELQQEEYIEIDVYPGYERGDNTLPQLFLTENGKIIMYAMGEYFLLERKFLSSSKNAEPLIECEDADRKAGNDKESTEDIVQVIFDYLHLDALEFQEKYKKEELYENGILYCSKDAWKYDGSQLDAFQNDCYDVDNITAIRICKTQSVPVYYNLNIGDQTDQYEQKIHIDCNTDYAVSIYSKPSNDNLLRIEEISFIKVELNEGTAQEGLYHFIENNYYEVMESLEYETWILSPDGEKAVCVSNGALPKHPSQIFIWYKDDKPLTIFRRTWEHRVIGWIDNDHLVCDVVDIDTPVLLHLERNEIEPIVSKNCNYDTYGAQYEIQENCLIAQSCGEQLYKWEILEKDEEIFVVDIE